MRIVSQVAISDAGKTEQFSWFYQPNISDKLEDIIMDIDLKWDGSSRILYKIG